MVYGTHLNSIYREHAKELHKRYRTVVSRSAVAQSEEDRIPKPVEPILSSSHTKAVTVRLAAKNSLDIVV